MNEDLFSALDHLAATSIVVIDLFRGSAVGTGVVAVAVIADIVKKDAEVKILLECTADEIDTAAAFLRDTLGLGATILRRDVS
ncbi:inorganic pyrophosphatase [Rhodococcus erythropolis]|uniref:inorganic pyrophosphatase n=1 Tax=Rhodococcus erythropolis TaxID=1833 RepID=UPI001E3B78F6|nr:MULTISPECIES: inorganic pyrophosphatase [Rhodococcus erythropolis group]MCD2104929.1 inorganic pyrophosphatase [Rhodococcus qingshengii]MCZ4526410.1 inorganic pyrophosphatase [Rhodococcus erythropolis]